MPTRRNPILALALFSAFPMTISISGCGAPEIGVGENDFSPEDEDTVRGAESSALKWWTLNVGYAHPSGGWNDTDLSVAASTPVQLRHASRLEKTGVYGWGYMPEFVDTVTGARFRILHLRPQHQFATSIGHVYPAGFIVGVSGGDTRDTGYPTYSTGAHLCIQTLIPYRQAFPQTSEGGGGASGGGAACWSNTMKRTLNPYTCVQSAADSRWYTCENGQWVAGRDRCGLSYGFCHSATLGKYVAPRSCVQSRADHVWYQCDAPGWNTPVHNGAGPAGTCSVEYAL